MIRRRDESQPRPGTLIRERMRVRVVNVDALWVWEGKWLRVPKGELGTIVRWLDIPEDRGGMLLTWNRGCAVQFDNHRHPHYRSFPMSLLDMYWDVLPTNLEEYHNGH